MNLPYDFWYAFWLSAIILIVTLYCTYIAWFENNRRK